MDISVTQAVKNRYGAGAEAREQALCCAVDYDPRYLEAIPDEVIERDYGCGDPSRYIRSGETVLDLGSGSGKICFIAAQIVGPSGRVIGVDMTAKMLELARASAPLVAEKTGFANVEFRRGRIQDLRTDPDLIDRYLEANPVTSARDHEALEEEVARLRAEQPLIATASIDLIVSNCVLNLVSDDQKRQLFGEMHRVLKPGGRIAIADIVSDVPSPQHLKDDPELWSGCVSGALQEHEFLRLLEDAGFYGITIDKMESEPWRVVAGIEYRAMNILAWKGKEGPCIEKNQAVIYKGPWKAVEDDDGHRYERGQRMAVCEKTFAMLGREPYAGLLQPVPPNVAVDSEVAFDSSRPVIRTAAETKAGAAPVTTAATAPSCGDTDCC